MRTRLGVYALGAADAAERRLVEAHLPGCDGCRAELAGLAPLPALLSRVPQKWVARQSPQVDGVSLPGGGRFGGHDGRRIGGFARSWHRTVSATAAAALAAGLWLLSHGADSAPAHQTFSAVDAATHVRASAALTGTSWGTSIQVTADGLPRGELCWLVVHWRLFHLARHQHPGRSRPRFEQHARQRVQILTRGERDGSRVPAVAG